MKKKTKRRTKALLEKKDREIIKKLIDEVGDLKSEDKSYLLGIGYGIALGKRAKPLAEDLKKIIKGNTCD